MELSLRTNRLLTAEEIKIIERIARVKLHKTDDEDFHRNCPPSFPMAKSWDANYTLSDGVNDEDYEGEYKLGQQLQEAVPAIVHF